MVDRVAPVVERVGRADQLLQDRQVRRGADRHGEVLARRGVGADELELAEPQRGQVGAAARDAADEHAAAALVLRSARSSALFDPVHSSVDVDAAEQEILAPLGRQLDRARVPADRLRGVLGPDDLVGARPASRPHAASGAWPPRSRARPARRA